MKKIVILLLLFTLILVGCNTPASDSGSGISVISTIFAPYDFTREIAGGHVDLTMLLPPASESHSYEPTPKDIIKIQNCDIFIYVGSESDSWVNDILDSMDTSDMKIITLTDCVDTVEEEIVEGMDHDDHEEEEHETDEHVWTSPKNAELIARKISDTLCIVDPDNAADYEKNTADYLAKLRELDGKFQSVIDSAVRHTIIFGDRFPFRYLADAYGLDYFAAFPGCSTETEASAAAVAFLIDKINAEGIPVVFHAELSNRKMAEIISESTGAQILLLHACHNVSKAEFENGVTYLDLMNQNVKNLQEALK